ARTRCHGRGVDLGRSPPAGARLGRRARPPVAGGGLLILRDGIVAVAALRHPGCPTLRRLLPHARRGRYACGLAELFEPACFFGDPMPRSALSSLLVTQRLR